MELLSSLHTKSQEGTLIVPFGELTPGSDGKTEEKKEESEEIKLGEEIANINSGEGE